MKRILALLFVLMMLPVARAEEAAPAVLELHQMELDYADGYYIRCGDIEIMIDGGKRVPFSKDDRVMECLRALGAKELDIYIVTHWHLDHCENVNLVLEEFGTAQTMVYSPSAKVPETVNDGSNRKRTLTITPLANGVYQQMKQGDVITFGPLTFYCTGPANGGRYGRTNPDSLNFVLQYGTRRIFFTGDYAASGNINKVYKELCSDVDVLKFPHHGGKPFEIGEAAIRTVNPEYILVPSYLNAGPIYRFASENGCDVKLENVLTMQEGHVVILTDGEDYLEARTQQNPADYAPKAN
nr:MBL fold metallo-hydrolase [Clostridia bacterium]